jgi:hypothetical protein
MTVIQFPAYGGREKPKTSIPTVPAIFNVVADAVVRALADAMAAEGVPFDVRNRVVNRLLTDEEECAQ